MIRGPPIVEPAVIPERPADQKEDNSDDEVDIETTEDDPVTPLNASLQNLHSASNSAMSSHSGRSTSPQCWSPPRETVSSDLEVYLVVWRQLCDRGNETFATIKQEEWIKANWIKIGERSSFFIRATIICRDERDVLLVTIASRESTIAVACNGRSRAQHASGVIVFVGRARLCPRTNNGEDSPQGDGHVSSGGGIAAYRRVFAIGRPIMVARAFRPASTWPRIVTRSRLVRDLLGNDLKARALGTKKSKVQIDYVQKFGVSSITKSRVNESDKSFDAENEFGRRIFPARLGVLSDLKLSGPKTAILANLMNLLWVKLIFGNISSNIANGPLLAVIENGLER